jgi:hypothetical protein
MAKPKKKKYGSHSVEYTAVEVWIWPKLLREINLLRDEGKLKYGGKRINLGIFIRNIVEWHIRNKDKVDKINN